MKKTVFKQLLLLAVFLFAGNGSAFGQNETYHVTINRVDANTESVYPEDFYKVRLVFLDDEGNGYYSNTGFDILGGQHYRLYVENREPDMYTVTSIEINGTTYENPGQYVNSTNNYIEIPNLSSDITATLTIAKAPTKMITVYGDPTLSYIYLHSKETEGGWQWVDAMSSDAEKVVFEVLPGTTCRLEIYPKNYLVYTVTSVSMGDEDITEEIYRHGQVIISSVDDDIDVHLELSKMGDTKKISVSMECEPDEYNPWALGYVEFYDPSRNDEYYCYNNGDAELLVNSTTQMIINTDIGWKVKTLKVDGTNVTETYYSQGYYEFKNLQADHSLAIELETAELYKIKVNRDLIPDNVRAYVYNNYYGNLAFNEEYEFSEGSFVTLEFPAFLWNEDGRQFEVKILDGGTDVTHDCANEWGYYYYTISNLSSDHQISLDCEVLPAITVNCIYNNEAYEGHLDFSLNDEYSSLGRPCQFVKGTDVTFSLRWIPSDKVVKSIKIGDNDITSTFNGSYVLSNLTEDLNITITLSDAEASYYLNAYFNESSSGTIYFKQAMTEKIQTTGMEFAKGSVATIFVKAPIGHEVSNINLYIQKVYDDNGEVVSDYREEDAEIHYNPDTKEYYCDITITAPISAKITTQKKADDGTREIAYSLGSTGIATFCSEYDLDFSTEATKDIAAYVAIGYNAETKKVMMMRVTEVQRGTGLLIVGKPGSYTIPVKATSLYYHNLLKPVGEDTTVPYSYCYDGCSDNYVLSGSKFTQSNNTPISAYQAYLQLLRTMISNVESVSIELMEMGDVNGDRKITIADAVLIVDKILNNQ